MAMYIPYLLGHSIEYLQREVDSFENATIEKSIAINKLLALIEILYK